MCVSSSRSVRAAQGSTLRFWEPAAKMPAEQGSGGEETAARAQPSAPAKAGLVLPQQPAPTNASERRGLLLSPPPRESRWGRELLATGLGSRAGLGEQDGGRVEGWAGNRAAPLPAQTPHPTTPVTPCGKRFAGGGCAWFPQRSSRISTL